MSDFQCFSVLSSGYDGFVKVRNVQFDAAYVLINFFSYFTPMKGVFLTSIT